MNDFQTSQWPQPTPADRAAALVIQPRPSVFQRNQGSFTVFGVVIGYLVLAATTGIVMLGIFPVMLATKAMRRREPLAVVALVAAGLAVVAALAGL